MENFLTQFASTESAKKTDILTSLGIDWKLLILQLIAFLILVWILAKWVYPVFLKIIDERQAKIDDSLHAAAEAEKKAETAEVKIEDALKEARKEAVDIVMTAKAEATHMAEEADKKAKVRAERIVAEAHEDIEKQVIAARKMIEKDTLGLVKKAAELAVEHVADAKLDTALVKKAIEGVKK